MVHILVAMDPSEESQNALVNALDIVNAVGGQVTAVHIEKPSHGQETKEASNGEQNRKSVQVERILAKAAEIAERRNVPIETEVLSGEIVSTITDYAEDREVDAIYVGHRGMSSGWDADSEESRGRLGSVAKGIVEGTHIPVTVFDRGL